LKHLIIAGPSRSGKTTLAKRISRDNGLSFLPFDSIISTLEDLYPQIGIKHQDDNRLFSPVLAQFAAKFFEHIAYEDLGVVIDLYQLHPRDYMLYFKEIPVQIVYLGYPTLTAAQKLAQIRMAERPQDWTSRTSETKMLKIVEDFLTESKLMYQQCLEFGLPFFDTGSNFQAGIVAAVEYLKTE